MDSKEYRQDIQRILRKGYNIDDLKEEDRAYFEGFLKGIESTEFYMNNLVSDFGYNADGDETILGKLFDEVIKMFWGELYTHFIFTGSDIVYSFEDGYEE